MRDDTPDDLVHDVFASALFPDHPLGREVIGFESTVIEAMTARHRRDYHGAHYQPRNAVIAAAGNHRPRPRRASWLRAAARRATARGRRARPRRLSTPRRCRSWSADTEQAHLVLGMRSIPPRRSRPLRRSRVLNQVLGGGMSSRLFQEVREQRGLAYSVYSFRAAFADSGYLAIYAGTAARARARDARGDRRRDRSPGRRRRRHRARARAAKGHLTGSLVDVAGEVVRAGCAGSGAAN